MPQINRLSGMGLPIRRGPFLPLAEFTGHRFTATYSLALSPNSAVDPKYSYTATYSLAFTPALPTSYNTGLPYSVYPVVRIAGVNVSNILQGQVSVTLADSAAGTFEITIYDAVSKPASYINKEISIGFQAADGTGVTVFSETLLIGLITATPFNERTRTLITLTGYDYSGIHSTRGELVSREITPTTEGSIMITGAGTFSTGQAPIWGVKLDDENREDVVDGTDWFASTLDGTITVPITSNFITTPGGLKYSYAVPFGNIKNILENIAGIKGWILREDGIVVNESDYTSPAKQPIISLSDESVIDIITKLLELTGGKLRGNLYPNMSIYNELTNLIGADNHILTEADYIDGSMDITPDIDGLLTEQTVRSVAKTYAAIDISASALIKEESGSTLPRIIFNLSANNPAITTTFYTVKSFIAEVTIPKSNIFSISHTASGQFTPLGAEAQEPYNIVDSDWTQTIKENEIIYRLETWPLTIIVFEGKNGFRLWLYTPAADWTLTINGQTVGYGETVEQTVSVTATRPVTGISTALVGDAEEHPWMETTVQGENLANAILVTAGNFYFANSDHPLHKHPTMKIGHKVNIKRGAATIYKGLCKRLSYTLDLETAAAAVGINLEGTGFGI